MARSCGVNWDALTSFQGDAILLWLRNSAVYAFLALVITLAVGIPAGYAMAMMEFRGRRALLVITLVVMLMPATTLVVPLFLEINEVHLVGSLWSVVLPFSFYPFGVYLTYIYFSTALPRDLLAAARIDGCTEFGAFRRVALPLAAPIIALVGFFSFVANWTNYFLPYVMLPQSSQYPVQVGIGTAADRRPAVQPDRGDRRRAAARTRPGHPRWRSARCCSCSCSPNATWSAGCWPVPRRSEMTPADIAASVPLLEPPGWALAERELFDLLDHAWRRFAARLHRPGRAAELPAHADLP